MKTTSGQRAGLRRSWLSLRWDGGADVVDTLLDDLDEALAERDTTARLLAAETAKVSELKAALNNAVLYKSEMRDALARQTPHLLKVEAERDALAAKVADIRELIERLGRWTLIGAELIVDILDRGE